MTQPNMRRLINPPVDPLRSGGTPTEWAARSLQGKNMLPPATPMQSMADILRTPQPVAPEAPPKYTPPPVNKEGHYEHRGQNRPPIVVDGTANRVGNGSVNAGGGAAQPGAAAGLTEPRPASLWGKAKNAINIAGSGAKSVTTGSILDADVGAAATRALRGGASAVGSFANGVGRVVAPVMIGTTAAQIAGTDTEEYAKRLGTTTGGFAKDVGLRAMGGITDFNDMVTFGHASKLANWVDGKGYVDNATAGRSLTPPAPVATTPANTAQPAPRAIAAPAPIAQPTTAAPTLRTQSFAAGSPEAIAAGKRIDSGASYIPGSGQGMLRNSRGDVVSFNTGGDGAAPPVNLRAQYAPTDYSREDAVRNAPSLAVLPQRQGLREERPGNMSFIEEVRYNAARKQDDRSRGLDIQEDANRMNNRATLRGQDLNYGSTQHGQDLSYGSTLRGQDLEMERGRLTAQATQRKNEFDMNRDIRKDTREQETHAQAVGDKAREGFVKEFGAFNPDGTPNQGLTAAKISAMQRLFPGIDMTSPEGRSKHLPDAQSTAKIYERIASNPQMGMDKLITAKGPGYDAMPDWEGATLNQQGYVGGKLTPGSEPNGWYITHKGVDTPLGADLSQRELEIIRHATKTGSWRGAPKNTQ